YTPRSQWPCQRHRLPPLLHSGIAGSRAPRRRPLQHANSVRPGPAESCASRAPLLRSALRPASLARIRSAGRASLRLGPCHVVAHQRRDLRPLLLRHLEDPRQLAIPKMDGFPPRHRISRLLSLHRLGTDLRPRAGLLHRRLPGPALESPLLGWNLSGLPGLQTARRPGGRCSFSSGTRVKSGCRRASRRRRATCRRMALLRDARHGGLLPPPRACERGVRDARTASLPDALPARLLGHARSVAALRVRTLPRHRDRGPRGHSRLLEKPRSSEPSLLGPLARDGSRVAPPHRLRSPDPCPRFSPDRRLADDPR